MSVLRYPYRMETNPTGEAFIFLEFLIESSLDGDVLYSISGAFFSSRSSPTNSLWVVTKISPNHLFSGGTNKFLECLIVYSIGYRGVYTWVLGFSLGRNGFG